MLPVIDLANKDDTALAEGFRRACEEVGFAYVVNHGVPDALRAAAFAATRAFHALPAAAKAAVARQPGRYRGYVGPLAFSQDRASGRQIVYETFIVGPEIGDDDPLIAATGGLISPNRWPSEPAEFRPTILAYWRAVEQLAGRLLTLTAMALGTDVTSFHANFRRPLTNMSLLHYPPIPAGGRPADSRPHRDTNALTILLPDEIGGLEVQRRDGAWFAVPPLGDGFVVNIGDMLEHWSGGRFRSTMHRVHPPEGVDRYALAFFVSPGADTEIRPLHGDVEAEPALNAGRDLAAFIAQFDGGPPKR